MSRYRKHLVAALAVAVIGTACGGGDETEPVVGAGTETETSDSATGSPTGTETVTEGETAATAEATFENETLVIATSPAPNFAPMYYGDAIGFFEERGVTLDIVATRGAGPAMSALASGSVDLAVQSVGVAAAASVQGGDVRIFCGSGANRFGGYVTRPDSDLPKASETSWEEAVQAWEGRSLGVPTLEGAVVLWARNLLSAAGLDPESVDFVPVGVGEAALNTLTSGEIDILFTFPFFEQQITDETRLILSQSEHGPEEQRIESGAPWLASKAWLDENPELAQAFCDWMQTLTDEVLSGEADEEALRTTISENFGVTSDAALDRSIAPDGPLAQLSTELDCEAINVALDTAEAAGTLDPDAGVTCESLLWEQADA